MKALTINLKTLASAGFLLFTTAAGAQQTNHMETLKKSGHAPVNGISMYYEIHGTGNIPLVLIHGGGSTFETSFGNILPLFAADSEVIVMDLQAHGRTTDRDAPESFAQDADDVAGLLKYLKVDKANILGFSNGGSTTMQIAIRHPEVVNKIVVIAGAYKRDGFLPGFFEFMPNATLANMPQQLQDAFLKVTPDKSRLQTMFEKDKARMVTFKDWSDDDLRGIKAPALFMTADHDVITVEHTQQMSRLVQSGQLIVLPGVHGGFFGALESGAKKGDKLTGVTATLVEEFLKG
jgi:pimeloyl-ACP methyl ester carboxylesterase